MSYSAMRSAMYEFAASYFTGGKVVFAEQKMAKRNVPYITLKFANVRRKLHPVVTVDDGNPVMDFQMQADMEVNLFTQGRLIGGETYENTALSDLTDFVNYTESFKGIEWQDANNLCVQLVDGTLTDLSEIINETLYRYRARAVFRVYYTETTEGMYGQGGITVPNASGGGSSTYTDAEPEYFETVEIEEDN